MPRHPAYSRDAVDAFMSTIRGGRDRPPIPRDPPPLTAADGEPEPPLPIDVPAPGDA